MNADPQKTDVERVGSADAARLLGVTDGRMRQLARDGALGAAKNGREWTFDRRMVEERSGSVDGAVSALADSELDSLRFERQFLVAEVEAQERRHEVQRLEAAVGERDATIAVLSMRIAELERRLDTAATVIGELAGTLNPSSDG